jgi:hypothetical protein
MFIRLLGPGGLALLAGCATGTFGGRAPGRYTQTTDSASSACLRNPACHTVLPGEEAVIPWLSRTSVRAVETTVTLAVMLQGAELKLVEQALADCAREADDQANREDEELAGRKPTREQCQKVVRREGTTEVTRAMELGTRKHELALDCVRKRLGPQYSEHLRVEPTYQKEPGTGLWRWLDPKQVDEWLRDGLLSQLWGALVPDVVIHASGNPNDIQRVYDFKFPCPADNKPSWRPYPKGHPHYPKDQKKMYQEALLGGKREPKPITPEGVQE